MKMKCVIFLLIFNLVLTISLTAGPYVAIGNADQWLRQMYPETPEQNSIRPLQLPEWDLYYDGWYDPANKFIGEPYPPTQFYPAELYASYPGMYSDPELDTTGDGLVMAWADDRMDEGSYASAWVFEYGIDPDLTNTTIQITVFPPQWGQQGQITQVSFGMRDVNGNIRSWYWNCGTGAGMLPWNTSTTITIDADLTGLNATNPPASSYMSSPAFDITQVQDFIVDENAFWVGGATPVPPVGQEIGRLWNYWKDLKVMPKKPIANKGYYLKYSQPAVELADEPGIILGWDELSVYFPEYYKVIMADDFICLDGRAITDFHWWGSFLGWSEASLPPQMPKAFHIAIWTDVPDPNPDDPTDWSMPGKMIWQHVCVNWTWNFAGFDRHPLSEDPQYEFYKNEACFQFNQLLSEPDWFYQKEGENIYWLSIAAIYEDDMDIKYPWGWKTRPHKFNDPAFRIRDTYVEDGTVSWPPVPGAVVNGGESVLIKELEPWDLAFEITTNQPAYEDNPIPGDIDANGIVDLIDFAVLATNWLKTFP